VIVAEIQAQDRQKNLSSAIRLFVLENACERFEAAERKSGAQVNGVELSASA
jgi:predicted DNA-binding ribbon-helix-helix protein